VIAAVIALVAGGAVYLSQPRHHAPAAQATVSPAPPGVSAPTEPDGIAGQTLAWDPSLRVPDAAGQPVWYSPASGVAEQIGGLPANATRYVFTRVVGGWAVQPVAVPPPQCGLCAGPPVPVWFLADGARSARRVGTANLVAPGPAAGTFWLTSYPLGANMTTAAGTAREVSAAGARTAAVALPPGYAIDQGTVRGLLLTPFGAPAETTLSKLWDPATRRATRTFAQVLASGPGEIAWASGCAPRCSVEILNLVTDRHTVIEVPARNVVSSGLFSPDGGLLALQLSVGDSDAGGTKLEVASVTSGRLTAVPGTWVSSDALVDYGWPDGDDNLVAEFSFTTKQQLTSWHPGARSPAVADVVPGPDQSSLILG
jgi:hypothetical protein